MAQIKNEKSPTKKSNPKSRALKYIENQRIKILDKLSDLEIKYNEAISYNSANKDSLMIYKKDVVTYKESVVNAVETGWVDIIVYRKDVEKFTKKYKQLVAIKEQEISLN